MRNYLPRTIFLFESYCAIIIICNIAIILFYIDRFVDIKTRFVRV